MFAAEQMDLLLQPIARPISNLSFRQDGRRWQKMAEDGRRWQKMAITKSSNSQCHESLDNTIYTITIKALNNLKEPDFKATPLLQPNTSKTAIHA